MTQRPHFVASVLFGLLAACGGTVNVEDDGGEGGADGGAGGANPAKTVVTSVGVVASTGIGPTSVSVVSSSGVTSSVDVVSSTGSGGFGQQDLFPQYLGSPSDDRNLFTLSDNALGAQIFARSPSNFGECQILRLTAPSGSIVYDGFIPSNNQTFYNYGVTSMVIPQIDHPEAFPDVAPGNWSVKVDTIGNANDITVLERQTIDGEFHGGVLDVNVFVVPGTGDPDYLLSQIQDGFANWADITLGDVRFFDAPDSLFEVDENNYFDAEEVSASAPPGQAINFVTVGYIGGAFEGAAGFTPGAPADPILHGSSGSTIVWWVQNNFFDTIIVGHESGHFAGLAHTTEFTDPETGFVGHDPLSDTPECDNVDDGGFDCGDYDYLMHPAGGSGAALLSPMQVQVIQGSAIYRGIYEEGALPAPPFQDVFDASTRIRSRSFPAPTLALDGKNGAARAQLAGPTPRVVRDALPGAVAALDGFGCGSERPVSFAIDEAANASSAADLLDLALDARAVPMFRMRALLAASRAAGASALADDFAAIAEDPSEPDQVRAGALRALARVAPQKRAEIAPALRGDTSRLVRHLASK